MLKVPRVRVNNNPNPNHDFNPDRDLDPDFDPDPSPNPDPDTNPGPGPLHYGVVFNTLVAEELMSAVSTDTHNRDLEHINIKKSKKLTTPTSAP